MLDEWGPLYTQTKSHDSKNHPKAVSWELETQIYTQRALELAVEWEWTMLRNHNILYGNPKQQVVRDASWECTICRIQITQFDSNSLFVMLGPNVISSTPRNIIHFVPCTIVIQTKLFGPSRPLRVQCKVSSNLPRVLDQSHNLYITGQGPSSS